MCEKEIDSDEATTVCSASDSSDSSQDSPIFACAEPEFSHPGWPAHQRHLPIQLSVATTSSCEDTQRKNSRDLFEYPRYFVLELEQPLELQRPWCWAAGLLTAIVVLLQAAVALEEQSG